MELQENEALGTKSAKFLIRTAILSQPQDAVLFREWPVDDVPAVMAKIYG
jgi:hypothetical protein